jgi:protein-S-isoprenylcysteine O-methyltransferase Ste14
VTGWADTILVLAWIVWIVSWAGLPLYAFAHGRAKRVTRTGRGNILSFLLLIAAIGLLEITFPGPLALLNAALWPDHGIGVGLGLGLALAGLAFSIWARVCLGSNWSASAKLKSGQELVTTGPYACVRHPIYLGLTVAIVGTGLVLGGVRVIASISCALVFSWVRIRGEDRLLSDQFGDEYARYRARVSAFLPGII